jgi:hypothetical protein
VISRSQCLDGRSSTPDSTAATDVSGELLRIGTRLKVAQSEDAITRRVPQAAMSGAPRFPHVSFGRASSHTAPPGHRHAQPSPSLRLVEPAVPPTQGPTRLYSQHRRERSALRPRLRHQRRLAQGPCGRICLLRSPRPFSGTCFSGHAPHLPGRAATTSNLRCVLSRVNHLHSVGASSGRQRPARSDVW